MADVLLHEWENRAFPPHDAAYTAARPLAVAALSALLGALVYRRPGDLALDLEDVRATLRRARAFGIGCATAAGPGRAARAGPTAPRQPPCRRAGNGRAVRNHRNPANHPRPRRRPHLLAPLRRGAATRRRATLAAAGVCTSIIFSYIFEFMQQALQILLEKASIIKLRQEALKPESTFNIFQILRSGHEEVGLHSRFLYELLNPKGSHGMGDIFLRHFAEMFSLPPLIKLQYYKCLPRTY
jgi:hypothetical protein